MRPSQASPGIARQKRTPFSKDTVGVALLGIFVLQHFFQAACARLCRATTLRSHSDLAGICPAVP